MIPNANSIQQAVVPLPVQQTADVHQLGTFLNVYKSTLINTIVLAILFLGMGVFFLDVGLFGTGNTTTLKIFLELFGVAFLGMGFFMIYTVVQAANQRVYLFQEGIVIARGSQIQSFPWNQTNEIWQQIIRRYTYGISVGTSFTYTLHRLDGYQFRLNNMTKGIAELGPALVQGVTQALLPRVRYALQNGQTVTFASFSINQQGISNGREWLSWSQIQAIEVKQGWINIKKVGKTLAWGRIAVAKIPNFQVFITVANALRQQNGV